MDKDEIGYEVVIPSQSAISVKADKDTGELVIRAHNWPDDDTEIRIHQQFVEYFLLSLTDIAEGLKG